MPEVLALGKLKEEATTLSCIMNPGLRKHWDRDKYYENLIT